MAENNKDKEVNGKLTNMKITPWEVDVSGSAKGTFDYDHIIEQFGCQKFDQSFTEKIQEVTKELPHVFLRRNLCFAHRDFDKILEMYKEGKKFYLYTGRGPSSEAMHLGHSISFLVCQYFQKAFNAPVVIQMTDDEKFVFKNNLSLAEVTGFGYENMKDIIAFGFDPELTYIFLNSESSHYFEENTLKISKMITLNEAFKVFGFDMSANCGMLSFPSKEIAPAYSSSFSFLPKQMPCLIPAAVDQDPYFRLARDKARGLGELKPATLYVSLLPDLRGIDRKMSALDVSSSIFLCDKPEEIAVKIKKHAFSGGQETLELHRKHGADLQKDIAFQYLRFFMDDDKEVDRIAMEYSSGRMMTSEVKEKCISVVQKFVKNFQEKRKEVTDDVVKKFMSKLKKI